jgi:hypothetical protein
VSEANGLLMSLSDFGTCSRYTGLEKAFRQIEAEISRLSGSNDMSTKEVLASLLEKRRQTEEKLQKERANRVQQSKHEQDYDEDHEHEHEHQAVDAPSMSASINSPNLKTRASILQSPVRPASEPTLSPLAQAHSTFTNGLSPPVKVAKATTSSSSRSTNMQNPLGLLAEASGAAHRSTVEAANSSPQSSASIHSSIHASSLGHSLRELGLTLPSHRLADGIDFVLTACSSDVKLVGDKPGSDYFRDSHNCVKRDLEDDVRFVQSIQRRVFFNDNRLLDESRRAWSTFARGHSTPF